MTPALRRGLIVAALHVAIVSSLGIKLLVDRQTRPRVWARVAPVDPDLPVRGRYVRLRIEGTLADGGRAAQGLPVTVAVRDGALVFVPATATNSSTLSARSRRVDSDRTAVVLDQPIAFFISEHARDPSSRAPGEELWAEVTLPRRGAPRPIRLAVKKDGVLTPLD
jgi:hypothetical protein